MTKKLEGYPEYSPVFDASDPKKDIEKEVKEVGALPKVATIQDTQLDSVIKRNKKLEDEIAELRAKLGLPPRGEEDTAGNLATVEAEKGEEEKEKKPAETKPPTTATATTAKPGKPAETKPPTQ